MQHLLLWGAYVYDKFSANVDHLLPEHGPNYCIKNNMTLKIALGLKENDEK